jgi:site-specific recombinase XerD
VIDENLVPIAPLERFLAHERAVGASPNTVRAYATALAQWWNHLARISRPWDSVDESTVRTFIRFLQTGVEPGTMQIGQPQIVRTPATINARLGAIQAFYKHAETFGIVQPMSVLFGPSTTRRAKYVPMLDGIAPSRTVATRTFKVTETRQQRPPVLRPEHIRSILDGCAVQDADGRWTGGLAGLRDRLLFAVLAETGMRLGEALSLRHVDMRVGQGSHPYVHIVPRQDHPHGARVKRRTVCELVISDELESLYSAYVWELFEAGIDVEIADVNASFIFVNVSAEPRFQPLRVESVYRRVRQLNTKCPTLPARWSPHWLRHTHATALLLEGTPFHVVQRRLGHADVQTTLNTYAWVDSEAELKALNHWKSYAPNNTKAPS